MTERSSESLPANQPAEIDSKALLLGLRRKQGSWVEWGQACQTLQKAGHSPQSIFEATGFEPIQQNQIIVAAQVYSTILDVGVSDLVKQHFGYKGSDILYEFRVLTQTERAGMAEFVLDKGLDLDEAREAVKAMKDFSRLGSKPQGFTDHPGDAIACQAWRQAKQKSDLQERSRLIARGLRYAHSATARQQVEQLLTDFSVTPAKTAPRQPVYRLDSDEELPRMVPVAGKFPLSLSDLQAVPLIEEIEPFSMVRFAGAAAWVPIPGWQVIRAAEDPVAILCDSDHLPTPLPGPVEEVLVIVDRALRQWVGDRYFIAAIEDTVQMQWFEAGPDVSLLGQVILIMRPKKVLDEGYTKEPWQIDE